MNVTVDLKILSSVLAAFSLIDKRDELQETYKERSICTIKEVVELGFN